jgi:hypothetical protein
MPSRAERPTLRFVRLVLDAGEARRGPDGLYRAAAGGRRASLDAEAVARLLSGGVLAGDARACRPSPETTVWLRRQMLGADGHIAQHRWIVRRADGTAINLDESPLARLAVPAPGEAAPFLAAHQVEAGERLRRLVERAGLQPRVTMSYDPTRAARSRGSGAPEIGDMAADARRRLAELMMVLPRDCADVVLDVCGMFKGLQAIERERGLPARSAKLVLRIALDDLARHFGLTPVAVGRDQGRLASWMRPEGRPLEFGPVGAEEGA